MNILVIGNGFDLAHGLPTRYTDFLVFCGKVIQIFKGTPFVNDCEIDKNIEKILYEASKNFRGAENGVRATTLNKALDECYDCIQDNMWLNYFYHRINEIGEKWIDFELEISRVIQILDKARNLIESEYFVEGLRKDEQETLRALFGIVDRNLQSVFSDIGIIDGFSDLLIDFLKKLIRALEIYIVEFVGSITIIKRNVEIEKQNFDHVLSFNYSDTFEKIYGNGKKIEYDYIHGKAKKNSTTESNNMVLGIDEYLNPEKRNKEFSFIAYKKYYQRIYKGTGCKYKDWIYEIKESAKYIEKKLRTEYSIQIPFIKFSNDQKHNLFIFGHSLDVTDKDILRDLILNDNVYTTIFYFNKEDLSSKITNLIKVIGQDELIRRTGGSTKTIELKLQQDMVESIILWKSEA